MLLRRGLSPLATTISTPDAARASPGSGCGREDWFGQGRGLDGSRGHRDGSWCRGEWGILVRGDSAYGNHAVVGACLKAGARFSVVLAKNPAVLRAIGALDEAACTPVQYPGAVVNPETGELISDAEVAEIVFTAFSSTKRPVTARRGVRRVRDQNKLGELFTLWRYHPFFTNSLEPTAAADITHRRQRSSRPCSQT